MVYASLASPASLVLVLSVGSDVRNRGTNAGRGAGSKGSCVLTHNRFEKGGERGRERGTSFIKYLRVLCSTVQ